MGVGTLLPIVSTGGGAAADHLSVEIRETNAPVEAGGLLDVTAALENTGAEDVRQEVEFVVGDDPTVVGRRIVPIGAGETATVDHLQFRTYPASADSEFPVRIEAGSHAAEATVAVSGIDDIDAQYATPDPELAVQPGTTVMFEVDDGVADDRETHWYVDGEYERTSMGPWFGVYEGETGADHWARTFESEGTYDVAAAVVTDDGNHAARWTVTVTPEGTASPTVDGVRPESSELPPDGSHDLELSVSSDGAALDRVVWWLTQSDVILDVSDVSGTADTASISADGGCHTCRIEAWVLDENNARTTVRPWTFDESASRDDRDGEDGAVDVTILETNDPVTGGDVLRVTAALENTGTGEIRRDVEFVVGDDPTVVDRRTVTVPAGETERIDLEFETYPVERDDEFPVRVETADSTDERDVYVYGTA